MASDRERGVRWGRRRYRYECERELRKKKEMRRWMKLKWAWLIEIDDKNEKSESVNTRLCRFDLVRRRYFLASSRLFLASSSHCSYTYTHDDTWERDIV